ncbi:MAG: translocation/assembly module TamB domain-containing protein [Bacteroidales bacterium]
MILFGILLLVPTLASIVLRIPEVQTFMVNRITGHFSERIKSSISVGRVEYTFFNKLVLSDLLIKDQNNDTMLYSQRISAGILRLDFAGNNIRLGHVDIDQPVIALITDTTGLMNLTWYLDMLKTPDDTVKKGETRFSVNKITIKDGRFALLKRKHQAAKSLIDFNNLRLSGINGDAEDFRIRGDSTVLEINDIRFGESNGFLVRSMNSNLTFAGKDILFRDLFLYLDSSIINANHLILSGDETDGFRNFTEKVRLDISLDKSLISAPDLRYFLPAAGGLKESVELSGRITGTVSDMNGRKITAAYRDFTRLECDFDMSGLPDIKDTFIHISIGKLSANSSDMEMIRRNGKALNLPDVIGKLGNISFAGSFTGFTTDFVTYGKIGTDAGSLKTDISFRPEGKGNFRIRGLVKGENVDLGLLTDNREMFGKLTMETDVDGYATSTTNISGNLTGRIDSVEVNKYVYRNVTLNGIFTEKTWDGNIKISDRNIRMDMLGMLDFSNELPEFDFTLNLAESNLYKLNFDKSDTTSGLSMLATANFRGNNIDNLFGEIRLLNSTIKKYGNKLDLYDFTLKAFNEGGKPALSVKTDFVDADLRGYYKFGEIGLVLKSALATLLPSKFSAPELSGGLSANEFTFSVRFRNTDKLNNFFKTGLLLSEKSTLNGSFYRDSLISVSADSRMLVFRNNTFSNFSLKALYSESKFMADLRSTSLLVLGRADLKEFRAGFTAGSDKLNFDLDWNDRIGKISKGAFVSRGSFIPRTDGRTGSLLRIDIDSTDVTTKNNTWTVRKSSILVDSASTKINRFIVSSGVHSYIADGSVSGNQNDTLKLLFSGIDLSPLNSPAKRSENTPDDPLQLDIRGIVDGNIVISSALKDPLIQSDLRIAGFSILSGNYGDVSVISQWNSLKKVADLSARNNLNGLRNFDLSGFYDPGIKQFRIDGVAANLPVHALNPLLGFFASDIKGTVSGMVKVTGAPGELVLTGSLMPENTSLKIDYLQTRYSIRDSIRFDRSGIRFRNTGIADEEGNTAVLNGTIYHKSFKDFTVDLTINMDKNNCLVLNTSQGDNELFYGTAYVSGVTTIKSGHNTLSFDISAKTGSGTSFFIPLNSGMSVSESSFVTFINHDSAMMAKDKDIKAANTTSTGSSLELNFDLDVTPDAEVQLLIDPKAGDVIRGKGSGKLNISLNRKGEFKIFGDYAIEEGDYLFTLKNILNKKFEVEKGGKISFNGNIESAEIDLTAKYRNIKTSLSPILFPILQDPKYEARIPVEPQLNLSGNLFNPVVGFNIYLPNADEETRTYLRNAITTEEEKSKQFIYLLVMNSFYADPSYRASSGVTGTGTSAMAVTTTEMLSNQLSNWLSQISNDFDVGFLYTPGTKDLSSQQLQVALSTQLLNDKVTINGNFDVTGTETEETPLIGDFDIEYRLTEKLRFKVFNRYNNPYTGKGAPYTQGLGFSLRQDFNNLSDIFKKKPPAEFRKEEEVTVEE